MNDKLKHFLVAVVIAIAAIAASHLWFPMLYNWDMAFGYFVATLAAAAKEVIYDKWLHLGTPDYYDFFWGFTGAVVGPALWLAAELILGVSEPLPNF
jgi:hypothetical protein